MGLTGVPVVGFDSVDVVFEPNKLVPCAFPNPKLGFAVTSPELPARTGFEPNNPPSGVLTPNPAPVAPRPDVFPKAGAEVLNGEADTLDCDVFPNDSPPDPPLSGTQGALSRDWVAVGMTSSSFTTTG